MSASPIVNVARYSALVGGIGYGILHRRTLQAKEDARYEKSQIKKREDLIAKAKEAYRNKLAADQARKLGSTVETNPDSPNFDLEKFLNSLDK
ncbi:unnamed protein product [Sympodiomycopsis kandeliae]